MELCERRISADIRGSGRAQFLFATREGNAIEMSIDGSQWWVEYWEVDENDAAPPVADQHFKSSEEAVQSILQWLNRAQGFGFRRP
jgi:hypothetical protein